MPARASGYNADRSPRRGHEPRSRARSRLRPV